MASIQALVSISFFLAMLRGNVAMLLERGGPFPELSLVNESLDVGGAEALWGETHILEVQVTDLPKDEATHVNTTYALPRVSDLTVDFAVWGSIENLEKSTDVTDVVNALIGINGAADFTSSKPLCDIVGDPAYGEQKALRLMKDNRYYVLPQDDVYNGGGLGQYDIRPFLAQDAKNDLTRAVRRARTMRRASLLAQMIGRQSEYTRNESRKLLAAAGSMKEQSAWLVNGMMELQGNKSTLKAATEHLQSEVTQVKGKLLWLMSKAEEVSNSMDVVSQQLKEVLKQKQELVLYLSDPMVNSQWHLGNRHDERHS